MADDYLDDWGIDDSGQQAEGDEFAPADPFEQLTKREQDIFFRVLDLLPREQLEAAMEYFMDNPSKIRAVVDYVKQEKDLIDSGNADGLKQLFEKERIVIEKANQSGQ